MKFAVILSGCGYLDGAEINESVFTLLSLSLENAQYHCFAPNIEQHHVTDFLTGEPIAQVRNVLQESARIARGDIQALETLKVTDFDGLIFPGGMGAACNLADFIENGPNMSVLPDLKQIITQFHTAGKPIAFMCIAPVLAAHCIPNAHITIGNDESVIEQLTAMGAIHTDCLSTEIVVDKTNNLVSTPAFMTSDNLTEVFAGIKNCIDRLIVLARKAKRKAA